MARIFQVPTYTNQTQKAIKNLMSIAAMEEIGGRDFNKFPFHNMCYVNPEADAFEIGYYDINDQEFNKVEDSDPSETDPDEIMMSDSEKFCYVEGLKTRDFDKYEKLSMYGSVIYNILNRFSDCEMFADSDATFELCSMYYSGEIVCTAPADQKFLWNCASRSALSVVAAGMSACQLGSDAIKRAEGTCVDFEFLGEFERRAKCAAEVWERARTSIMTDEVRKSHKELHSRYEDEYYFRVEGNYVYHNIGMYRIYKVSMYTILITKDLKKLFVLDYAHLDQMREVMRTWHGMEVYARTYRVSTGDITQSDRFLSAYRYCFSWLVKKLSSNHKRIYLAKYMKTCLAILQNNFHDHAEKLNVGASERSRELVIDACSSYMSEEMWHDALGNSGATMREQNNLAYLFHLLPGCDTDIRGVFNRVTNKMNNANRIDEEQFERFFNYCKATDAAKYVVATRGAIKLRSIEGYEYKESQWHKACSSGKLFYPPPEEWGMCWVEDSIPTSIGIGQWYLDAGDVTRVNPDIGVYESWSERLKHGSAESNELLWTLQNAPMLAPDISPERAMEMIASGEKEYDTIADMAGKNENTKFNEMSRETWSADSVTRELMSEVDHAAIPVAANNRGVTSRKTDTQVQKTFDKMCEYTVSKGYSIIVSTDISGWSPSANRDAWVRHHQYVIDMTSTGKHISINTVLSGIHAVVAKRGYLAKRALHDGLFQGWTGTCDTLLNNKVCLYAVRIGKDKGYLSEKCTADTASLIDDAVQGIQFPSFYSEREAQIAADMHLETTQLVWKWISAEVSMVKTLFSSIKFIFLNRFYCEGSEVLSDMKTFSKVDRDFNRRLSTINQQCDTILGSYRSAVLKGSDPVSSYCAAITRSLEIVYKTNKRMIDLSPEQIIVSSFAPRTLLGLGLPHYTAFLTKERVDNLTMFLGIIARLKMILKSESTKRLIDQVSTAFIKQEMTTPGPIGTMADPASVRSKACPNHETHIYRKLKARMKTKCKSEVMIEAFELAENPICAEVFDVFMKSYAVDSHVLSAVTEVLPESVISGMVDKAHKADLILSLFPFKVKSEMIYHVKKGNVEQIRSMIEISNRTFRAASLVEIDSTNYIHIAQNLRDEFFGKSGYKILNNTTPDPATMLARQRFPSNNTIGVKINKIYSYCNDEGKEGQYANVFDGHPEVPGRKGFKTAGIFGNAPASSRGLSAIQKRIHKMSQIVAHLQTTVRAEDAEFMHIDLWRAFCVSWGAGSMKNIMYPDIYIEIGVSWKRIDKRSSNRSHPIVCYPNGVHTVEVNSSGIGKLFDIAKVQIDLASVITAAKLIGLTERAPYAYEGGELYYSVLEESFAPFGVKVCYDVAHEIDRQILVDFFDKNQDGENNTASKAFESAMVDYTDITPADEDCEEEGKVMGIFFPPKGVTYADKMQAKDIATNILNQHFRPNELKKISMSVAYRMSKAQRYERKLGDIDESALVYNKRPETKFAIYSRSNGAERGGMQVLMDLIKDSCPCHVSNEVYAAGWGTAIKCATESIENWEEILRNALVAVSRIPGYIIPSRETLVEDFGLNSYTDYQVFTEYKMSDIKSRSRVFAYLYYFTLGKFRVTSMYTSNASIYPNQMKNQWSFARIAAEKRAQNEKDNNERFNNYMSEKYVYETALSIYRRTNINYFPYTILMTSLNKLVDMTDVPEIDIELSLDARQRYDYVESLSGIFEAQGAEMNIDRFCSTVDNVVSDFAAYMSRLHEKSPLMPELKIIATQDRKIRVDNFKLEDIETVELGMGALSIEDDNEDETDNMYRKLYEMYLALMAYELEDIPRIYSGEKSLEEPDRIIDYDIKEQVNSVRDQLMEQLTDSQLSEDKMLAADES